jgi:ABC-type iron transport system FetAB ATPase subunit
MAPAQSLAVHAAHNLREKTDNSLKLLRIKGLSNHGVGPVDLAVGAGECVCLSGPSGAGKTVLLRAIADLEPHAGDVTLEGRSAAEFAPPEWRRQVGLLPAESQWWRDRIGEHFDNPGREALEALGFGPEVMGWEVARCSTGERQRLALLRLLVQRPRVLLLDEPTAALDPEGVGRVERFIDRYRREQGAAILWVSHNREQIQRVADRHYRMEAGHLHGAPA